MYLPNNIMSSSHRLRRGYSSRSLRHRSNSPRSFRTYSSVPPPRYPDRYNPPTNGDGSDFDPDSFGSSSTKRPKFNYGALTLYSDRLKNRHQPRGGRNYREYKPAYKRRERNNYRPTYQELLAEYRRKRPRHARVDSDSHSESDSESDSDSTSQSESESASRSRSGTTSGTTFSTTSGTTTAGTTTFNTSTSSFGTRTTTSASTNTDNASGLSTECKARVECDLTSDGDTKWRTVFMESSSESQLLHPPRGTSQSSPSSRSQRRKGRKKMRKKMRKKRRKKSTKSARRGSSARSERSSMSGRSARSERSSRSGRSARSRRSAKRTRSTRSTTSTRNKERKRRRSRKRIPEYTDLRDEGRRRGRARKRDAIEISDSEDDEKEEKLFEHMLRPEVSAALMLQGIQKPSVVQRQILVSAQSGRDVIAQGQTGTGKTTAACLVALENIRRHTRGVQALFMSPTRELADQIAYQVEKLGKYLRIKSHTCIGGVSYFRDFRAFQGGTEIVSGTPGRVLDNLHKRIFDPSDIKLVVVEEADRMFNERAFAQTIREIFRYMPRVAQVIFTSATIPETSMTTLFRYTRDPITIFLERDDLVLRNRMHFYVCVRDKFEKVRLFVEMLTIFSQLKTVVFLNQQKRVQWLADLIRRGGKKSNVRALHGAMSQPERFRTLDAFRRDKFQILICTDVFARGLDVSDLRLVVNFDLPSCRETYINRIGRIARFKKKGAILNFAQRDRDEVNILKDIEQFYACQIHEISYEAMLNINLWRHV